MIFTEDSLEKNTCQKIQADTCGNWRSNQSGRCSRRSPCNSLNFMWSMEYYEFCLKYLIFFKLWWKVHSNYPTHEHVCQPVSFPLPSICPCMYLVIRVCISAIPVLPFMWFKQFKNLTELLSDVYFMQLSALQFKCQGHAMVLEVLAHNCYLDVLGIWQTGGIRLHEWKGEIGREFCRGYKIIKWNKN